MQNLNTGFFDNNGDAIFVGHILIVGDDPRTHKKFKITQDEKGQFYASIEWSNGVIFSQKLENILKNCSEGAYIQKNKNK